MATGLRPHARSRFLVRVTATRRRSDPVTSYRQDRQNEDKSHLFDNPCIERTFILSQLAGRTYRFWTNQISLAERTNRFPRNTHTQDYLSLHRSTTSHRRSSISPSCRTTTRLTRTRGYFTTWEHRHQRRFPPKLSHPRQCRLLCRLRLPKSRLA